MGRKLPAVTTGDLVVLPKRDPLVSSLRPEGMGLVLGPADITGVPKWKERSLRGCVAVMWGDRVSTFHASRLRVVVAGKDNNDAR